MKKFNKNEVREAWLFLYNHPYYAVPFKTEYGEWIFPEGFESSITAQPVRINPKKGKISNNDTLNTEPRVWLESGCFCFDSTVGNRHGIDYKLNTSAKTWEKAIVKLANKICRRYGDLSIDTYFDFTEDSLSKWEDVINGKFGEED